mmetsp:Transcript_6173/g.20735  ORF Transcript_6173/g.20735 Transcript_6173/m.20735 type:complete len:95 (+) Transcript_6173:466-750(+)
MTIQDFILKTRGLGHSVAGGAHSPLARTRSTTRLHGSLPLRVSAAASSALAAQSWTRKPLLGAPLAPARPRSVSRSATIRLPTTNCSAAPRRRQ